MRANQTTNVTYLRVIRVGALAGFYDSTPQYNINKPSQFTFSSNTLIFIEYQLPTVPTQFLQKDFTELLEQGEFSQLLMGLLCPPIGVEVLNSAYEGIQLIFQAMELSVLQFSKAVFLFGEFLLGLQEPQSSLLVLDEFNDLRETHLQVPSYKPLSISTVLLGLLRNHIHYLVVDGELLYQMLRLFMCLDISEDYLIAHPNPIEQQISSETTQNWESLHPIQEPHVQGRIK